MWPPSFPKITSTRPSHRDFKKSIRRSRRPASPHSRADPGRRSGSRRNRPPSIDRRFVRASAHVTNNAPSCNAPACRQRVTPSCSRPRAWAGSCLVCGDSVWGLASRCPTVGGATVKRTRSGGSHARRCNHFGAGHCQWPGGSQLPHPSARVRHPRLIQMRDGPASYPPRIVVSKSVCEPL